MKANCPLPAGHYNTKHFHSVFQVNTNQPVPPNCQSSNISFSSPTSSLWIGLTLDQKQTFLKSWYKVSDVHHFVKRKQVKFLQKPKSHRMALTCFLRPQPKPAYTAKPRIRPSTSRDIYLHPSFYRYSLHRGMARLSRCASTSLHPILIIVMVSMSKTFHLLFLINKLTNSQRVKWQNNYLLSLTY